MREEPGGGGICLREFPEQVYAVGIPSLVHRQSQQVGAILALRGLEGDVLSVEMLELVDDSGIVAAVSIIFALSR